MADTETLEAWVRWSSNKIIGYFKATNWKWSSVILQRNRWAKRLFSYFHGSPKRASGSSGAHVRPWKLSYGQELCRNDSFDVRSWIKLSDHCQLFISQDSRSKWRGFKQHYHPGASAVFQKYENGIKTYCQRSSNRLRESKWSNSFAPLRRESLCW